MTPMGVISMACPSPSFLMSVSNGPPDKTRVPLLRSRIFLGKLFLGFKQELSLEWKASGIRPFQQ